MGERHDYVALEWVRGEIAATLDQARQALEGFVEQPEDVTGLRFCLNHVHQVHGTLRMVECQGAVRLAEDMELVLRALVDGQLAVGDEALQLLMQAILQLPGYLERVQQVQCDLPQLLLPLRNALRQIRGVAPAAPLFSVDLSVPRAALPAEALAALEQAGLPALLRKLRQMLQLALVGLMRGQEVPAQLERLDKVFARLEELCGEAPLGLLWSLAAGLVEGLRAGSIESSPALYALLREVDREFKRLLEEGLPALNRAPGGELLDALLQPVAGSAGATPRLAALKAHYRLDEEASSAPAELGGLDRGTLEALVGALREELVRLKERLDLFVRGDRRQAGELQALQAPLKQMVDTLLLLGFEQQRKVLAEQLDSLARLAAAPMPPDDAALMDVAGALLFVEASLSGMVGSSDTAASEDSLLPTTDVRQVQRLVLREARSGLEQTKDAIIEFIASHWSHRALESVPTLLGQVRGALEMLALPRAAALLDACARYVGEQVLAEQRVPSWPQLDALADALTSVEYYLERLAEGASQGEALLDVAEDSLAGLGYPPGAPSPARAAGAMPAAPAATAGVPADEEHAPAPPAGEPVDTDTDTDTGPVSEAPLAVTGPLAPGIVTILPPPADEAPLDEELREVFIEEAGEVLDEIAALLPRWQAAPADTEAVRELRRAFHTLKGSGRMVRALVLGELAWAVENLLNRVIERSVAGDASLQALVGEVLAVLPALVDEYAAGAQRQRDDVDRLAARAQALAEGRALPAALLQPLPPAVAEPAPGESLALAPDRAEPPAPVEPSAASAAEGDSQLLEIFRGEAEAHLATLDDFLAGCDDGQPHAVTDELQRALHTLRGSACVAGAQPIAELAAPLERLAKDFKSHRVPLAPPAVALLRDAGEALHAGLAELEYRPLTDLPGGSLLLARAQQLHASHLAAFGGERGDAGDADGTPPLLGEAAGLLLDAEVLLLRWREAPLPPAEQQALQTALEVLRGQAAGRDLGALVELADALLDCHREAAACAAPLAAPHFAALAMGHEALVGMLDQLAAGLEVEARPECLQALRDVPAAGEGVLSAMDDGDPRAALPAAPGELHEPGIQRRPGAMPAGALDGEMLAIFLEEATDILDSVGDVLQRWEQEPPAGFVLAALQQDLHTLTGGARMSGVREIGDLAHELEAVYEGLADGRLEEDAACLTLLREGHGRLVGLVDALREGQPQSAPDALLGALRALRQGGERPQPVAAEASPAAVEPVASQPSPPAAPAAAPARVERDTELLEIFLDEGFDIIESAGEALRCWLQDPAQMAPLAALQRDLHTLKGGARMAEVGEIGDLAHELEFLYEALGHGRLQADAALSEVLHACHDSLLRMLEALREDAPLPDGRAQLEAIRRCRGLPPSAPAAVPTVVEPAAEAPREAHPEPLASAEPVVAETAEQLLDEEALIELPFLKRAAVPRDNPRRGGQEQAKVSAELLERLVNLAGETSIFRGRVEQQVSDMRGTLGEMEATIERVRDQLRRLDTETQAQILSRHQSEGERAGYEEFDPLEMDRYSQLQQLSRALFESASDLLDLKETLAARNRDAETLLLQQARVNTELQEGLMRTRMVPFERLVPRLRRIVRQVAAELGKQVELEVSNAEGEMDRRVLEGMQAPLEHMLRNAIDHGIETAAVRAAAGKPAQGMIRLSLAREGSDICLSLADDGGGVDVAAVRRKAIERGLLDAGQTLPDHEALQFILAAGFSTARAVTQISGRGVGLDVVASAVRQLGGAIEIDSQAGQGTRFAIRLPFTVSVNRALMVECDDDLYALPLSAVEGIVRVAPEQLARANRDEAPTLEYAGRSYRICRLGELLDSGRTALSAFAAPLTGSPLPVVLLRGGEQPSAVQVDALAGSREVVVKSLGSQFAAVPGLGGATILGDGRVVVILDVAALLRARQAQPEPLLQCVQADAAVGGQRAPLVMVVDDSVTVRKVSARLLERHGMQVLTAKDGVDALAQLQDVLPDVMLLDIEMPRMDGFEVASQVRHDARLRDLPIIMITSRTGTKHRERAEAIGVNHYLGKPFQESDLLAHIQQLVDIP